MKKISKIIGLLILMSFITGCNSTATTSQTKAVENKEASKVVKATNVKTKDNEYKKNINKILDDLNKRIDFDYNEALVKYDFEFLAFNKDDLDKAENIYNVAELNYNKNKNNDFKDINSIAESLLSKYKEVIDGRHLVLSHKGDTSFLSKGYSLHVVTPINDVKKLKDSLQSELAK